METGESGYSSCDTCAAAPFMSKGWLPKKHSRSNAAKAMILAAGRENTFVAEHKDTQRIPVGRLV